MYVAALQNALGSDRLLQRPICVPDHQTMEAITHAALRGVRVHRASVIIPRH